MTEDEKLETIWRDIGEGRLAGKAARVAVEAAEARRGASAGRAAGNTQPGPKAALGLRSRPVRRWPRSPDRRASLKRRRRLAGSGALPQGLRGYYTQGEAACLAVIAQEARVHGFCALPNAKIAALAGVQSRSTVQKALKEAVRLGHITRDLRPIEAFRNDTNILRIISREWLAWLRLGRKKGGPKSSGRPLRFLSKENRGERPPKAIIPVNTERLRRHIDHLTALTRR